MPSPSYYRIYTLLALDSSMLFSFLEKDKTVGAVGTVYCEVLFVLILTFNS
jgi:hypothetical protein